MYLLTTFGGLRLMHATTRQEIGAPRRKPLALLALIAAAGERGAERDWLAAMLWPELSEPRARRALSQTLYSLRRELDVDVLRGVHRYTIDPSTLTSDATEFEELARPGRSRRDLERAAAVYAGPYLDGVHFPGCTDFDHWTESARAVHAGAYQGVLRELARMAADAADMPESIKWLEHAAREFPLDSDVAAALARGYAEVGRHGQAHASLTAHFSALQAELGTDPPASLVSLARELRAAAAEKSSTARRAPRGSLPEQRWRRPKLLPDWRPHIGRHHRLRTWTTGLQARWSAEDRWKGVATAAGVVATVAITAWMLRLHSPNAAISSLPEAFSAEVTHPTRAGAGGILLLNVRPYELMPRSSAPTSLAQYVDDMLRKRLATMVNLVPVARTQAIGDSLTRTGGKRAERGHDVRDLLDGSRAALALHVDVGYSGAQPDSVVFVLSLYRRARVPPCPEGWNEFGRSKPDPWGHLDGFESWSSFRLKAPTKAPTRYVDSLVRSASRIVESMRTCDLEAHRASTTSPWCWTGPNRVGVVPGVLRARISSGEDIRMTLMSREQAQGRARYCSYSTRESFAAY
jgi:DNA-binding SARP family transcriptional activator